MIVASAWAIPESPRWLYVHNKKEAARDMLIKYHGGGNPQSSWVKLQLREYEEYLVMGGSDKVIETSSGDFQTQY